MELLVRGVPDVQVDDALRINGLGQSSDPVGCMVAPGWREGVGIRFLELA